MGAPSIPMQGVMAYAYAALEPTPAFMTKFISEVDKLLKAEKISERDHQLLRSSQFVQEEILHLTLGEEQALTTETITETLQRVTIEINAPEKEKLDAEKAAHKRTQNELLDAEASKDTLKKRIYWKLDRKAGNISTVISAFLIGILFLSVLGGLKFREVSPWLGLSFTIVAGIGTVLTLLNMIYGIPIVQVNRLIRSKLLTRFLRAELIKTGIEFGSD